MKYIYLWIKERGMGHYSFINSIMFMLFGSELKNMDETNKEKLIESEFTLPYICNYIIEILINFTNFREDGTLNLRIYLDTIFIKIVDIWGFIISYLPIFEALYENHEKLNKMEAQLFESLKHIFIKYLFSEVSGQCREIRSDSAAILARSTLSKP